MSPKVKPLPSPAPLNEMENQKRVKKIRGAQFRTVYTSPQGLASSNTGKQNLGLGE